MKMNSNNFQFMILSKNRRPRYNLLTDSNVIKKTIEMELLGLHIDSKLSLFLKKRVKLCRKASYKLHLLRQINNT